MASEASESGCTAHHRRWWHMTTLVVLPARAWMRMRVGCPQGCNSLHSSPELGLMTGDGLAPVCVVEGDAQYRLWGDQAGKFS